MSITICIVLAILIVAAILVVLSAACFVITRAWVAPDRLWKRIVRPLVRLVTAACLIWAVYLITLVICGLH